MRLYETMQRLPWPRSYVGRLLFICFVGTHVPLIALCVWALTALGNDVPMSALVVALVATLVGTGLTLAASRSMLKPVILSADALEAYVATGQVPELPVSFHDKARRLMATVQSTIDQLDEHVSEITRVAMTDELTGAHNRRRMNETGILMGEDRLRKGTVWSLLVIDLDDFKTVNDTWGHSIGDQVLIVVADAIRSALRDCDHLVRTGGDEFCVIPPDADGGVFGTIAERVRSEATRLSGSLPIDHVVTISIGGATARKQDGSFIEVYRRTDRHLYDVKTTARNVYSAGVH